VAPCSHVWHYKCIRPILNSTSYPNLLCPNCRASIDLEADVDEAYSDWENDDDLQEAIEASKREGGPLDEQPAPPAMIPGATAGASSEEEMGESGVNTQTSNVNATTLSMDTDGDYEMLDATIAHGAALDSSQAGMAMPLPPPPLGPPPALSSSRQTRSATAAQQHRGHAPAPIDVTHEAQARQASAGAAVGMTSATPARNIPHRSISGPNGVVEGGPMTPRNDAGPFVLDGGAGTRAG
jgi:hypothetical protein